MTEPAAGVAIVGVVGAGTMGAGIAQVALEAGHEVVLHDVDEAAIARGRARVADGLRRRHSKTGAHGAALDGFVDRALERLRDGHSLDAVAAEADVVIEAALEDLALKQLIFRTLDGSARADTLLATNTSALPVAAIAAATTRPERVLGLHFFNPAPVMPLVEIVVTGTVAAEALERADALVRGWGKTPIRVRDGPGFLVNRVNRPFTLEPLRLLEQGRAGVGAIDDAIVGAGFPLGPFAYMDLVGVDVNLAATTAVWDGLGRPDRLRPSPIQRALVDAGKLGRKTGQGFYVHENSRPAGVAPPFRSAAGAPADMAADAIVERVRLALANEAFHALDAGMATAEDVDRALRLGASHPAGPLEWTLAFGLDRALEALESLAATEGSHWAPAPGFVRAAHAGAIRASDR
ncbi:MAG TPA: 3-hydroxyacyl-CoA dehydrogenase NAD-binding domain-containing protein [Candidatus Limnocylindrales bacterium]|nr:3-hydroxyacyl-CoA dehydrogenase NAD-binding domain-containing protein [Candidatus Limnocylindrales bacterium]